MTKQQIVWTTSPNGSDVVETSDGPAHRVRLSVTANPRLESTTGHVVGEFPDFVDWPTTVAALEFSLEVRGTAGMQPYGLSPDPNALFPPNPVVWGQIFGAWTTVETFEFDDHANVPVLSYPESVAAGFFADAYRDTGVFSALAPPTAPQWRDATTALPQFWELARTDRASAKAALRGNLADHGALTVDDVMVAGKVDPAQLTNVVEMFLGDSSKIDDDVPYRPPSPTPDFDFHRAVAMASQYPMLQRTLGLVVDLVAFIPADVSGDFDVRAVPGPDPSADPLLPWTRVRLERGRFGALPRDPALLDNGKLLTGDASRFTPITLDVDGATMKLLAQANSIVAASDPLAPQALASLRSAGVGLAMTNRGKFVSDALKRAKDNNIALQNAAEVVLYAEDLLRGYRIDVWEAAHGRWSSLMTRQGKLTVGHPPEPTSDNIALQLPLSDEGLVTTNPTQYESDPGVFRVPESLFNWTGWSLANPQPGRVLDDPSPGSTAGVVDPPNTPQDALPVTVDARPVGGSLPVLRFGQEYRLRARCVDTAGNGPAFDAQDPDVAHATAGFRYLRYEPVAAPEVLLYDARTEGETVTRLVIRSEGPNDTAGDTTQRHIAPPKSSWQMSEWHGLLDRMVNGRVGPDPAKYGALGPRERGGFGVRTGADGTIAAHPDAQPRPEKDGLPLPDSTYHYPVPQVAINYLPEYLARGATMWPLPGSSKAWDTFDFEPYAADGDLAWPDYSPFRLVLQKGTTTPVFSDRVLTIGLAKAEVVEINLSSNLSEGDQDLLAVYGWVEQKIKEQFPQFEQLLRDWSRDGIFWMFTPSRKLTLVHAVRVPLKAPLLRNLSVVRDPGSTEAQIMASAVFDRASTTRVDVRGSWVDCVDDPTQQIEDPTQFERPATALAFSVEADRLVGAGDVLDDELAIADPHRFGDTKHRMVTYQGTGISRFTEYFVEHIAHTASPTSGTDEVTTGKPFVPGSEVVKSADGTVTYRAGADYTTDPPAGKILVKVKPKLGLPGTTGVNVDTKLDIAFLPTPHDSIGEPAPSGGLSIPSSARPEPPSIKYIVPTFGWSELPAPGSGPVLSSRSRKGVRIYLDRPWYSSGCGEQLAVVLWLNPGPVTSEFPDPPHQITHWALDPLYRGPSLPSPWPTGATFPAASELVGPLELPGFQAEGIIGAAVHDVEFDIERQLWFCDVDVNTGLAYTSFVRLALARYQKQSLQGLELSQVVRADYAQVGSDRLVGLVFDSLGRYVDVALLGVNASTTAGGLVAQAWIEEHDPNVVGDDVGWERVGGVSTLSANPTGAFALWSGRLRLKDNGRPRRVVVQQFELFPSYPPTIFVDVPDRRLVHSDIIPI